MTHKSRYHSASASSFEKDDMSIKLNCADASCSYVWSTWLEWTPTMLMWIHAWPCETSDWMTLLVCTWETSLIFHHGPLICFAMCSRKKQGQHHPCTPGSSQVATFWAFGFSHFINTWQMVWPGGNVLFHVLVDEWKEIFYCTLNILFF